MNIAWTEYAIDDLKSIHTYVSLDSKVYADKLIDRLVSRVEQLKSFPDLGRIVPEFNKESLRELIEGRYRIVYKREESSISIVRIHNANSLIFLPKI
ncbi:MAG: type II toxin-antitoxin system RelE/ParE family toxin [Bacteroidota bacterium]